MAAVYHSLMLLIAGATDKQLARHLRYLKAENQILRSKLTARVTVTVKERGRLVRFAAKLGGALDSLATIVHPDTIRRGSGKARNARRRPSRRWGAARRRRKGDRLWCTTKDAKVRHWDTASGKVIQEFVLKTERAESASISISSARVATIPGWPVAQVWDLRTGQLLRDVEAPHATPGLTVVALSRDGARLAIGTESRSLSVHDIANGKTVFEAPNLLSRTRSLAFPPDGKRLISGMEDTSAIIWDVPELKP